MGYSERMDFSSLSVESINNFFVHNPIFTVSVGISALIATSVYLFGFSDVIRKEAKRRRMKHRIDHLKDHYILCGFGRVGQQVARELAEEGEHFVILEREEAKLHPAKERNWAYIVGDVAVDETMFQNAQIANAKGVIISVGTDADAIFMAISARALKPDVFLVARASSVEAADKLTKIGVHRVALPYQIGGYHMATMALRPSVVDFLDLLVDQERDELEMEEYHIHKDGFYDGKTLKEAGFVQDGLAVLAIRRKNGKAVINPSDATALAGGDKLVVMGCEKDLQELLQEVSKKQPKDKEDDSPAQETALSDDKISPFLKKEGSK